jgi:hypothetical protein
LRQSPRLSHHNALLFEGLWDGEPVERARQRAANRLAEKRLPSFTEVVLEGDGALVLGEGLAAGPGQVEDGLPPRWSVPAKGFFCGRAKEYLEAAESLEDNQLTALGLWGIGGMGKTALATELAARNAWRYPAGVAFVDIRGLPAPERTVAGLAARTLADQPPRVGFGGRWPAAAPASPAPSPATPR